MTSILARRKMEQVPVASGSENVFRLLDLPLEIRQIIYQHLFTGLVLDLPDHVVRPGVSSYCDCGMLGANRQLREEALPIFYRLTSFVMSTSKIDFDHDWEKSSFGDRGWARYRHIFDRVQNVLFRSMGFLSEGRYYSMGSRQAWEKLMHQLAKLHSVRKITFQAFYRFGAVHRLMSPQAEACFEEYKREALETGTLDITKQYDFEDALLTVTQLAPLTVRCIELMKESPLFDGAVIWKEIGLCDPPGSKTVTVITERGFKVFDGTEGRNQLWKIALRKLLGFEEDVGGR